MDKEKVGGYEAHLTKRAQRRQDNQLQYDRAYSRAQVDHRPDVIEFANRIFASVDKKQISEVLLNYLAKAGVPVAHANVAVFENVAVRPTSNRDAGATYYSFTNLITLSTTDGDFLKAKEAYEQNGSIPSELLMKMQLFFIHEICHAFSRNRIYTKDANNSQSLKKVEEGYKIKESVIRQPARKLGTTKTNAPPPLFEALDEGVTQRIAEEVFLELSRRTGNGGNAERFLKEFVTDNAQDVWRYSIYGSQVDSMCEQIAAYTGVSKNDVWGAFKRGYFAKPELFAEETAELFKETFGENFLDEYSKLNNKTPLDTLGGFDGQAGFPHPEEYAKKWLEYLGISRH